MLTIAAPWVAILIALLAAGATVFLAWQTRSASRAARDSAKVGSDALCLQRRQFDRQVAVARPQLKADVDWANDQAAEGRVSYVGGTDPAVEIDVWLRRDAVLLHSRISRLTLIEGSSRFRASEEAELFRPGIPAWSARQQLAATEQLVRVTWALADGSRDEWDGGRVAVPRERPPVLP